MSEKKETPCLNDGENIQCCHCTDVTRKDEHTVMVLLANGDYVKLTSNTPILAVYGGGEYIL